MCKDLVCFIPGPLFLFTKKLFADAIIFPSPQELYTPTSGFKVLQNRLKVHWTISQQRDEITLPRLRQASLVIFGLPRDRFSAAEVIMGSPCALVCGFVYMWYKATLPVAGHVKLS